MKWSEECAKTLIGGLVRSNWRRIRSKKLKQDSRISRTSTTRTWRVLVNSQHKIEERIENSKKIPNAYKVFDGMSNKKRADSNFGATSNFGVITGTQEKSDSSSNRKANSQPRGDLDWQEHIILGTSLKEFRQKSSRKCSSWRSEFKGGTDFSFKLGFSVFDEKKPCCGIDGCSVCLRFEKQQWDPGIPSTCLRFEFYFCEDMSFEFAPDVMGEWIDVSTDRIVVGKNSFRMNSVSSWENCNVYDMFDEMSNRDSKENDYSVQQSNVHLLMDDCVFDPGISESLNYNFHGLSKQAIEQASLMGDCVFHCTPSSNGIVCYERTGKLFEMLGYYDRVVLIKSCWQFDRSTFVFDPCVVDHAKVPLIQDYFEEIQDASHLAFSSSQTLSSTEDKKWSSFEEICRKQANMKEANQDPLMVPFDRGKIDDVEIILSWKTISIVIFDPGVVSKMGSWEGMDWCDGMQWLLGNAMVIKIQSSFRFYNPLLTVVITKFILGCMTSAPNGLLL